MSTIVINPADMSGVPYFNILNNNVIDNVDYSVENTEYSLSTVSAKNISVYSVKYLSSEKYYTVTNILSNESKNPDITVFAEDVPILYHYNNKEGYISRRSLIKYDISKPSGIDNIDINDIKYNMYEMSESQSEDDPLGYISYPKTCKFVDGLYTEESILNFFLTYDENGNPIHFNSDMDWQNGDILSIIKINKDTLSIYVVTEGIVNVSSNLPNSSHTTPFEKVVIKLKLKSFSKNQETFGDYGNFSLSSNELNQQNTRYKGKQISEYVSENIKTMYWKGKKSATLTCYCVDYYDIDGNIVYEKDSGSTISVNDTVRPMIRRNDILVPMSTLSDGTPVDFIVVGSEIFYDGKIKNTIEIVESPKTVVESRYGEILENLIKGENSYSLYLEDLQGLTSIGDYAFARKTNLKSIQIPETVKSIGSYSFAQCDSIKTIDIPNSVKNIKDNVFYSCDSLTNVTLPESMTKIPDGMFRGCKSLNDINVPESVTVIEDDAFYDCVKITKIPNLDKLTKIGSAAFLGCEGLVTVNIPDNVLEIGSQAFSYCKNVTRLAIGTGLKVTSAYSAFDRMNGLESIDVSYEHSGLDSRFNCNAIMRSDSNLLLVGCKNTQIPSSTEKLYSGCFQECVGLKTISIPDSVTEIGSYSFDYCSNLESVEIGTGIKTIDSYSFSQCEKLKTITIKATTPPTLASADVFYESNNIEKIYIPVGTLSAYSNAEHWSKYSNLFVEA